MLALCAVFVVAAVGATLTLGASPTRHTRPHRSARPPAPVRAEVTVAPSARRTLVPASYLGLSTEYWALPQWSGEMPLLARALSLVHARGDGPLVLRVGGDSADHALWDPTQAPLPAWAFPVAPRWLRQAGALVRSTRVRLILDLNLITDTPAAAAQWARAAEAGLPRHSIEAFEIGNEPDIYSRAVWMAMTGSQRLDGEPQPRTVAGGSLPARLSAGDYVRDFRAYARALGQVAPHTILAGPALANPDRHGRWVTTLIDGARRSVGMVTIHRYPYAGCPGRRDTRSYATIGHVLSPAAATGMAQALRPLIGAAHDAGVPLRLTELNSVNCGGLPGVSDAFATALWAPDALFSLLRAGADGVNLHVRADAVNAPFALDETGLHARPLLYGLILFARALGPHAQLVRLRSHLSRPANLAAWAVRVGQPGAAFLHVLLEDKGRRAERVSLQLPGAGSASVQRLVAPSARARTGVTLDGQALGRDGRWHGVARTQTVRPRGGVRSVYTLSLRPMSAALISVRVAPGSLGVPAAPVR